MTIHINAKPGEIAKFVLMPGDPLRAKIMAEKFLVNPKLVNSIRGMSMFSGTYKGMPVTIAASGMGNGSMGIYSYELFNDYGVETIIRVGTAGAYRANLAPYSIFLGTESYGESNYAKIMTGHDTRLVAANPQLVKDVVKTAEELKIKLDLGRVHSTEAFYRKDDFLKTATAYQVDAVEMETFSLYVNAQALNKKAVGLFTISDNLITGEFTSAEERQNKMDKMFKLALETGVRYFKKNNPY